MPRHLARVYPSDVPAPKPYETGGNAAMVENRAIVNRLRVLGFAPPYVKGVTPSGWYYIAVMRALNEVERLRAKVRQD